MPVTALSVTTITREGVAVAAQASDQANGNSIAITGFEMIGVTNGDGSPRTITFVAQSTDPRGLKTNKAVAVTNGTTRYFGPFQKSDWADANGLLQITWSAGTTTACTIQVFQLLVNNPASTTE